VRRSESKEIAEKKKAAGMTRRLGEEK